MVHSGTQTDNQISCKCNCYKTEMEDTKTEGTENDESRG